MLIHCARNDPERNIWLWILFIGSVPAALVYFLVRWLPGSNVSVGGSFLSRWTKRRQLPQLELAAQTIGNAHQFVQLGDAYREAGSMDRAAASYEEALKRDQESLPALWGAALVAVERGDLGKARSHLTLLLAREESYKFGDASLAMARVLYRLKERDAARRHLERHVKRWATPEAHVMLATILIEQSEYSQARGLLERTLLELSAGPRFFARRNNSWGRQARRLLSRLPQEGH
jgi:hypothetical protein